MKHACTAVLCLLALMAGTAGARHRHHDSSADNVAGRFDYYLLTLSWSPAYCIVHPDDTAQCRGRGFGFVLHGLWPQFNAGGWPEYCSNGGLPADAFALGVRLYPSPKLVRHEWQRHGTCSGLSPAGYFQAADRALAAVKTPAMLEAPRAGQARSAQQIEGAFRGANPGLPAGSLMVGCSRGELAEVRVCLTRDLAPRACGRGVRSSCPPGPVKIRGAR